MASKCLTGCVCTKQPLQIQVLYQVHKTAEDEVPGCCQGKCAKAAVVRSGPLSR